MAGDPLRFEGVALNGDPGVVLDLCVPAHTTVSVLGDEASGVRSLGPFALGLAVPTQGRVLLLDTDLATLGRRDLLAYRRRVGYLPAGDGLMQNLTLSQNIGLPLRFGSDLSERDIDSRLSIMLAAAGLTQCGGIRPSGANEEQRRRAALARALAFDPAMVVMEYPFVGLTDRAARAILEIARGGEVAEGSRRAVLVVGNSLPDTVARRFEQRYRIHTNRVERES